MNNIVNNKEIINQFEKNECKMFAFFHTPKYLRCVNILKLTLVVGHTEQHSMFKLKNQQFKSMPLICVERSTLSSKVRRDSRF